MLLFHFGKWRDVCGLDCITIIRSEGDCWRPAVTKPRGSEAAHRLGAFGGQIAMIDELFELLSVENRTPLSMATLCPLAFEIRIRTDRRPPCGPIIFGREEEHNGLFVRLVEYQQCKLRRIALQRPCVRGGCLDAVEVGVTTDWNDT